MLALVVYGNTLGFDYALDDHIVITGNRFTHRGLAGIPAIFAHDSMAGYYERRTIPVAGGRYRPLALATFAVEYALLGERPAVSHALNVLLFGATVVLVFLLLARVFPDSADARWYGNVAFLATALFAVHPVHTEVVANIKGRDDLLSLLFGLSALLCWWRSTETRTRSAPVLAGVLFFLALLSKESAVGLLAVVPLIAWYFLGHSPRRALTTAMPFAVATLGYLALRLAVLGFGSPTVAPELMNDPFLHAQDGQRLATVLLTWLLYLKLLIFPHTLTHDYYPYHIQLTGFLDPGVLASMAVFAALVAVMVIGIRPRTVVSFWIAWYLVTFAPVSNLLFGVGTFMNERFIYIPSIAFCALLAVALHRCLPDARLVAAVSVLLIVAGSAKSFARNFAWRNDATLALTDVETSRGSARAQMAAGWVYVTMAEDEPDETRRRADLTHAIDHLRISLSITDDYYPSVYTMGVALADSGEYAEALGYYESCFRMKPRNPDVTDAVRYIAEKATEQGDWPSAIRAYEILLAQEPSAALYASLGQLYGKHTGDLSKAQEFLQEALRLDPADATVIGNLGIVYAMTGRADEAIALFDRALAANPTNARMYLNKARALRQLGRVAEADQMTARAVQLDPSLAGR